MGSFDSVQVFPYRVTDLESVARDVMEYFKLQGYEVSSDRKPERGWLISIRKGDLFKAVIGMKTALNIELEPTSNGIMAKAGFGLFGLQAIPTAIAVLAFWPVLITQSWGFIQQSKLDSEAMNAIERSLRQRGTPMGSFRVPSNYTVDASTPPPATGVQGRQFCANCGARLQPPGKFCSGCGTRV